MIPRLLVEVAVPKACVEALGITEELRAFLRKTGVLAGQAEEVCWRLDTVNMGGDIMTYSVPVRRFAEETP